MLGTVDVPLSKLLLSKVDSFDNLSIPERSFYPGGAWVQGGNSAFTAVGVGLAGSCPLWEITKKSRKIPQFQTMSPKMTSYQKRCGLRFSIRSMTVCAHRSRHWFVYHMMSTASNNHRNLDSTEARDSGQVPQQHSHAKMAKFVHSDPLVVKMYHDPKG